MQYVVEPTSRKLKPTPGPWVFHILRYGWSLKNSAGKKVNISPDTDDGVLIMAAPELLQALRDIANIPDGDLAKYVARADSIACEVLAKHGFDL